MQTLFVELAGHVEKIIKISTFLGIGVMLFWNRNAAAGSQITYNLWKALMFKFHEIPENIAALATAKTVINLFISNNMEARGFFLMKRAKCFVAVARGNKPYMLPDNLNDIGSISYQRYYFSRNKAQAKPLITKKRTKPDPNLQFY